METRHEPIISDARVMEAVDDQSIDLVVTSPPYPMIQMWDETFASQSSRAAEALENKAGTKAFDAMHQVLDKVWEECFRVLKPGGFACINIGDATRTIDGKFALYPNHARILTTVQALGFSALPCIIWRKQTNAPNKYMGSGMLPAGAYITLEHEYILVLRKGGKRVFNTAREKELRQESALFWEERNIWFSDIWLDLKGSRQTMGKQASRKRSGAFPFELAFRLVNMYSVKGDRVLDPFMGTGTTMAAAMAAARHSMGFELDPGLAADIEQRINNIAQIGRSMAEQRLLKHISFVLERTKTKGPLKYANTHYGFPVMTSQEKNLLINSPLCLDKGKTTPYTLTYDSKAQPGFCRDWKEILARPEAARLIHEIIKT